MAAKLETRAAAEREQGLSSVAVTTAASAITSIWRSPALEPRIAATITSSAGRQRPQHPRHIIA